MGRSSSLVSPAVSPPPSVVPSSLAAVCSGKGSSLTSGLASSTGVASAAVLSTSSSSIQNH
jgi:hypothetical protein